MIRSIGPSLSSRWAPTIRPAMSVTATIPTTTNVVRRAAILVAPNADATLNAKMPASQLTVQRFR